MIDLRAAALVYSQAKHILLILLDHQSVNIRCITVTKGTKQLLVDLLLHLIKLFLSSLDLVAVLIEIIIQTVDMLFLEVVLLMRDLILTSLSIHKRLVHPILVMQSWHSASHWTIAVTKELFHLVLALLLARLESTFMLLIHSLALGPLVLTFASLWTYLLMSLALLISFELVLLVVLAVESSGQASLILCTGTI